MLTAEGIIGKLVLFIVNKSVCKIASLPFDKRKKACRSLTKLYYCIQTLDEVTEYFETTLRDFENLGDSESVIHALNNNSYHIELATNMFIDLGYDLQAGLEIIDPALAKCCHLLYISKFDFLTFLSNYVEWEEKDGKRFIKVKMSKGLIESVDLENLYDNAKRAIVEKEKFYWPSSALDDFSRDFENIYISFEDDQAAIKLRDMIRTQNEKLKEAKEYLRVLLKDSFSLEEILFQSDSKPGYRL
jgi:hypothetical protein